MQKDAINSKIYQDVLDIRCTQNIQYVSHCKVLKTKIVMHIKTPCNIMKRMKIFQVLSYLSPRPTRPLSKDIQKMLRIITGCFTQKIDKVICLSV